jgi:P27 family predicted phage terminase small subunit
MAKPKRAVTEVVDPKAGEAPKAAAAPRKRSAAGKTKPVRLPQKSAATKKLKKAAKPKKAAPPPLIRETIGGILEPDWARLLPEADEQTAAADHWRRVAREMHELEILSLANGHALQRLVLAYLVYDRCSKNVAADGLVTEPNKDNPKSIARLSIHYKAMREAENTAERLEGQLGLTPGKRGRVGKVTQKRERKAGADAFLQQPT